jgi:hypothetical protein
MSDEHFTVDGTLLEAWASQKSLQRKDGDTDGDGRDFRGHDRKNETHASTTDPDARLYRKSNNAEARLAYLGHLLMENRHALTGASYLLRNIQRFLKTSRHRQGHAANTDSALAPSRDMTGHASREKGKMYAHVAHLHDPCARADWDGTFAH